MDFLFKNITNEKKEQYLNNIVLFKKTYTKGDIIFNEGDKCQSLALILKGSIIAKSSFIDGRESVIKLLSDSDVIGEALLFSSSPVYKANFIVLEDTILISIQLDDLKKLIQLDSQISLNLLNKISDSYIKLNAHIKLLSKKSIKQKLASFLYQEYISNNSLEFSLALNKSDLAIYLNTERPSLSTVLNQMIKDKIISNNGSKYKILDLNELINMAQ